MLNRRTAGTAGVPVREKATVQLYVARTSFRISEVERLGIGFSSVDKILNESRGPMLKAQRNMLQPLVRPIYDPGSVNDRRDWKNRTANVGTAINGPHLQLPLDTINHKPNVKPTM
jgi:hypothetical protein